MRCWPITPEVTSRITTAICPSGIGTTSVSCCISRNPLTWPSARGMGRK